MASPYRPTVATLIALALFAVLFVIGGSVGWWPPAEYEPAIGGVSRWCERVSSGLLREPINTLGNLGFVISGLAMFIVLARETDPMGDGLSDRQNRFVGNQPVALAYAGATVFLGPGSMLMHGSHTFFGAWIDNVSMVAYILIPWMLNVAAMRQWTDRRLLCAYAVMLAGYGTAYWFFGSDLGIGMDLFGLSIALWIISETLYRFWSPPMRWLSGLVGFAVAFTFGITPSDMAADIGNYWWIVLFWLPGAMAHSTPKARRTYTPWFWAGMASFLLAFAVWTTGRADHDWCQPDSIIQAHAVWHLLTAVSTWCFFRFLRTERLSNLDTTG